MSIEIPSAGNFVFVVGISLKTCSASKRRWQESVTSDELSASVIYHRFVTVFPADRSH